MYASDQDFFVVGAIEDTDLPAFRENACCAPQEIVLELFVARLFETIYLASLRIDTGHHVRDSAVLSRGVHPLEDHEQCIPVVGVVEPLQSRKLVNVFLQLLPVMPLRLVQGLHERGPLLELDLLARWHTEVAAFDFHPALNRNCAISLLIASGCSCCTQWPAPSTR